MARHIHPIIGYIHALCTQSCPLFIARWRTQSQAQTPTRAEYPVPRQAGVAGQLAEGAADPSCRAAQPRQFGKLPVTDDLALRHLAEH